MFGKNFIVKKWKIFLKAMITVIEILSKNGNDFTQLCLLKVKIQQISYGFNQYRYDTDFYIELDGFIRTLAWTIC